jgi:hypothetical protein
VEEPVSVQCLQCGQSRAVVWRERLGCATVTSGESVEADETWERHRWADWTDWELERFGVVGWAFERYRRTQARDFQWLACEHSVYGHSWAEEDDPEFGVAEGQCWKCGRMRDA